MICSFLCPSRARPDRLAKTLDSIFATATMPGDSEVLVKLDVDEPRFDEYQTVVSRPGVKAIWGPRKNGYASLAEVYTELALLANGDWMWVMNDDAWIGGVGWDVQLAALPTTGLIVQPEIYQLGLGAYPRCEGGAFPVVPRLVWERFGHTRAQEPIDTWLDQLLRFEHGWTTHFLPGIAVVHERDRDEVLAEHRRL